MTVTSSYLSRTYANDYYAGIPLAVVHVNESSNGADRFFREMFLQAGLSWCYGSVVAEFPPSVAAAAVTRFRLAALEGVADLGVTLGELRQTAGFVTELCRGTERIVRGLANATPRKYFRENILGYNKMSRAERRRSEAQQTAGILHRGRAERRAHHESNAKYQRRLNAEKAILKGWLMNQFAVKPLVNDLVSSVQALDYWQNERQMPLRLTVKKGARRQWRTPRVSWVTNHVPNGKVEEGFHLLADVRQHISGVFEIEPGTERTLQMLGLTNGPSVAWELIPFSWLVDYGLGVGDWIKQMTRMDHMVWVEGAESRLITVTTDNGEVSLRPEAPTRVAPEEGRCFVSGGRFSRRVMNSPPPAATMPLPKSRLGITQMANAMAALSGMANTRSLRI